MMHKIMMHKMRMRRKHWILLAVLVAVPTLLIIWVRFFVDEPLRRTIEQNVNKRLDGYTVRIRDLKFHPIGLSLDLLDSTIFQDAHPDPPIAYLPKLSASVHWRALLHGRLVADFLIDRPVLHINLKQARTEVKSETPMSQRGWQDALEEIYPLKVNKFVVRDAEITYEDQGPFKPLHLSQVTFRAGNIRNVHSKERVYPSDVHLDGKVFESGSVTMDGHADFMAEPHPGIKAQFALKNVELDYFKPLTVRYHVSVDKGALSADGHFEYAPTIKVLDIKHVTIDGVQVEYIHQRQTAEAEKQVVKTAVRTAKRVSNDPEVLLRIDEVHIRKSRIGFVNKAADREYRLFLADTDLRLDNLSNQGAEGTAVGVLRGKFMGTGDTRLDIAFKPQAKTPNLDLKIRITDTHVEALNDVWLAYGGFDVARGQFSFFSELTIKDGRVEGYIKPLLKDMQVYEERQDRQKGFFRKIRERLVGIIAWILENKPREEVGTVVRIAGELDSPQFSTWEAAIGFLENAFVKALAPGLERDRHRRVG